MTPHPTPAVTPGAIGRIGGAWRRKLLPESPVLTPDLHERGGTGRYRRCASPHCGIKRAAHFYRSARTFYRYCDACRAGGAS